jgi:predicted  nucleic acid-binding Zn-ribbon protein
MITIYADDKKIYDPRIEKLQLEEAELSQAKNKAGSMTFTIPAAHTYAQTSIIPGITRIIVKEDEETVFKGRITKTNPNFFEDIECTAEGDLAYLNDTVVRPYEYAGSPREYFAFLIAQHNAQVEKKRQFTVGRVTVADPNDYIVRSSAQYPSTWEELETKLLDSMGGFLVERWEDGITYLDYLAEIRENNNQIAKYGENIVDIDRIRETDSGFATAVIPLGKKQEAEEGKEAQYLTIESINNGVDYVQNDDAVSKYGLILKTVEHEDVTLPENLLRKGREDLAEAIKSVESITVTAADLSGTGVNIESFRFMKNVRCVSKRHGLDFRSPIVSLTRNLLDRSDYKITVGDTQKSYTGASITSKRETESKAEEIINLEREARKKAIEDLVSKVEKAPGLYITDTGEGEAHNWYLHDKKTVEESYIIIRVNTAGIIFSTDGGKTYNGVSWEGDAILRKIYAIGIDANYINAGELNAAIVKIKNLHLQDISDGKGVTLDATLNGITADVSAKYTELDGKISDNSASISMLPDSITSTVKKSYIDPLTGRVTEAENDIESAENRIAQNEKDILAARSEITQTASSITANVSALYQELDGKISKNTSSISLLPDSITSTVKTTYIDPLTGRVSSAESDIDAAEERITQTEKDILSAKSSITQTASSITADVSAKYKELDGKISSNTSSISLLPDSITSTVKKSYIDPLDTRVSGAETNISNAEKRITQAEKDIVSAKSSITQTSSSITADVEAKYKELDGKISDNAASISLLPDSITSTVKKSYIDALDKRMTTAETNISQASDSISASVKKNYIDPLSTRVTNTESNISSATERITAAEASIKLNAETIESKVSKGSVISTINQSAEKITISADKIDFDGSVTFSNTAQNASDALSTAKSASSTASAASATADNASKTASSASTSVSNLSSGLSSGTTKISGDCITTGKIKIGAESYINTGGSFKLGSMQSVGELNNDVEFKHAIFVDYGIELLAGNDGATPYIDFHTEATDHDSGKYDYTARIQNTQESWISFYGKSDGTNPVEACTVQAGQFRGTFVNVSDARLKSDIEELNIENVLSELMQYRPVSYKYVNGVDTNIHHGLIAQEAKEVSKWGLVDDRGQYLAVCYTELVADLIAAVQYAVTEIGKLKAVSNENKKETQKEGEQT